MGTGKERKHLLHTWRRKPGRTTSHPALRKARPETKKAYKQARGGKTVPMCTAPEMLQVHSYAWWIFSSRCSRTQHPYPLSSHPSATNPPHRECGRGILLTMSKQTNQGDDEHSRNKASTKPNPEGKILYKTSLQGPKKTLKETPNNGKGFSCQ